MRDGTKTVAIFGGGVAGMTAAHELVKHGYHVVIYEARRDIGGKARSQYVAGTGTGGRKDLPGEHGFRFYPAFYKHIIETMAEIPLDPGDRSRGVVADNLRSSSEAGVAPFDGRGLRKFLRRRPKDSVDLVGFLSIFFREFNTSTRDAARFAKRILRYYASCRERRLAQYEEISWWTFLGGHHYNVDFQRFLRCVPRIMVAMDARHGSARTIGNISMQLISDYARAGSHNDRTLVGPTTEAWLSPWRAYLETRGVRFFTGKPLLGLDFDKEAGVIKGARVAGEVDPVTADYYIAAVPLEAAVDLVTPEMASYDEKQIANLRKIKNMRLADSSAVLSDREQASKMTDWMVGIQFFLREDVPLVRGHVFYPDSPWALSSISQAQFWHESGLGLFRQRYGNGEVGGVLSVDISDWNQKGTFVRKPAKLCTAEEIRHEVWEQIKRGINAADKNALTDALLYGCNLDQDLEFPAESPDKPRNTSPLLVHPPGSFHLRPTAETGIHNLMLASDYVQTETILACMEGANEAARRAVRAILRRDGLDEQRCALWDLKEDSLFDRAKQIDEVAFRTGRVRSHGPSDNNSFFREGGDKAPESLAEVEQLERLLVTMPELA